MSTSSPSFPKYSSFSSFDDNEGLQPMVIVIMAFGVLTGVISCIMRCARARGATEDSVTQPPPAEIVYPTGEYARIPMSPALEHAPHNAQRNKTAPTAMPALTTPNSLERTRGSSEASARAPTHSSNPFGRPAQPQSDLATLVDDPAAVASQLLVVRVPLEKIERIELISRGGFGEVYRGRFKGVDVAIKALLPEKRKDVAQIKAFLAEIKFMSTLDHPRIVQFVGVAWESLSELCVVTEFLSGGDLRSLLMSFETSSPPRERGFDADKIKIALHVAHALTYLHSLQPIVLHRDLKSRNILLDSAWDAKLTDFGVSRERIDHTMTAGVGSSLWMAPEVMMGERYDEKADMFSFGVVLSELDTQQLPYADAREEGTGRQIPQTAVLQLVSMGRLSISITSSDRFPELQQLARDCVSLSAGDRPTAAEALHRLHIAWREVSEPGGLI